MIYIYVIYVWSYMIIYSDYVYDGIIYIWCIYGDMYIYTPYMNNWYNLYWWYMYDTWFDICMINVCRWHINVWYNMCIHIYIYVCKCINVDLRNIGTSDKLHLFGNFNAVFFRCFGNFSETWRSGGAPYMDMVSMLPMPVFSLHPFDTSSHNFHKTRKT